MNVDKLELTINYKSDGVDLLCQINPWFVIQKKVVFINRFINKGVKGAGRFVLGEIIEYLLDSKLIEKDYKIILEPVNARGKDGSQEKLEQLYIDMGFKITTWLYLTTLSTEEKKTAVQSIETLLQWYDKYKKYYKK